MKAIIDKKEVVLKLASTANPYSDQWHEIGTKGPGKGRPVRSHSLPKGIKPGMRFYTNGHHYEIMR